MSIVDFIKTKEQKENESKEYFNKLFPQGASHRDTVKEVVEKLFPEHKDFDLFYTYIVIKELHLDKDADEDRVNDKTEHELKKIRPRLGDDQMVMMMILLSIDLQSPRLLTVDEYIKMINTSLSAIGAE